MLEACSRLSPKQLQFCQEFLRDLNGTAAYRRTYQVKNSATAAACAARLLTNAKVQEQIRALIAERSQRTAVTADRVLQEIAAIAFSSMGTYADWGPNGIRLRDSAELEEADKAVVAEINSQALEHGGVQTKIKLHDKLSALSLAAKHTGLLNDLNIAIATFRRYGFLIEQDQSGYRMVDTYSLEVAESDLKDLENI